jgi:BirA family biotin operon repressor/biotin-[acetyl-CoA-carboxylase] ligase
MTESHPDLPGLYELVVVDKAASAKAYAEKLAADGAEEGTLVWARKQTEGVGRKGNYWISGEKNLHCAVILRPEESFETCCQLSLLTSVCACQAITVVGEPLEELRLGWPNDIYLNRGKVAGIQLSGELNSNGGLNWMVVSLNLNAFDHPTSLGFSAASLRGEGFEVFDRVTLMEIFAREFLAWLDRWVDQGLAPIRKAWLWRGDWTDQERTLEYEGRKYHGVFQSLEDNGTLNLGTPQGTKSFRLDEFYRPEFHVIS